jgi:hypothetical protein
LKRFARALPPQSAVQRVAVRSTHAQYGCENASLEDSRTTMMDTGERSMSKSEVDRSNIIATRYRATRGVAQCIGDWEQVARFSKPPEEATRPPYWDTTLLVEDLGTVDWNGPKEAGLSLQMTIGGGRSPVITMWCTTATPPMEALNIASLNHSARGQVHHRSTPSVRYWRSP